jgi:hypothetical protein
MQARKLNYYHFYNSLQSVMLKNYFKPAIIAVGRKESKTILSRLITTDTIVSTHWFVIVHSSSIQTIVWELLDVDVWVLLEVVVWGVLGVVDNDVVDVWVLLEVVVWGVLDVDVVWHTLFVQMFAAHKPLVHCILCVLDSVKALTAVNV